METNTENRSFHSTGKGSPCPFRPCKVGPQAVFRKIILAGGSGIFLKNLHSRGHGPLVPVE